MNTDIELRTVDPVSGPYLAAAAQVFDDVERRFSRFRGGSELSRLNARTRSCVHVSAEMLALLTAASSWHRVTQGVFDPSILPELEASGYDRSFELIKADVDRSQIEVPSVRGSDTVAIDEEQGIVTLPPGMRIDLGGIGKGGRSIELRRCWHHAVTSW